MHVDAVRTLLFGAHYGYAARVNVIISERVNRRQIRGAGLNDKDAELFTGDVNVVVAVVGDG